MLLHFQYFMFKCRPYYMNKVWVRTAVYAAILFLLFGAGFIAAFHDPNGDMYMSHSHCYLFNRGLILLHGWSDFFIGLSYVMISATLVYLVLRSRRELPFHWMMLAFALFIVACGATHFMELWTLQAVHPRYWLAGWLKLLTAFSSLTTALLLPPLVPKIRALLQATSLARERKTELETAYAQLSELYKKATEAAQAQEMAEAANSAKDQFLAVLSHELRTPLTPALAAVNNLESGGEVNPEELRESIALIRRNIELEARLVDDLLDSTRISKGKLEVNLSTIDLHETIRHAVEMGRSAANTGNLEMVVELNATEHYVHADGARLAQVFWNLILNAVKFTPSKGSIIVRTMNPSEGRVQVEVSDNGIGIEPEMLSEIFAPFQQAAHSTPRRFGGIGLGLSIAKGLVEAHNGTIAAHSAGKGLGATFVVDLATVEPPSALRQTVLSSSVPTVRSRRILIVEDHEDSRHVLTRLLTNWGHKIEAAATIEQALEKASAFRPEMLLCDIGLPDGTGMELLGKLRQDHDIPAIAMSGYGMDSDREQTSHAGFNAHLVKPVDATRLKQTIERIGER